MKNLLECTNVMIFRVTIWTISLQLATCTNLMHTWHNKRAGSSLSIPNLPLYMLITKLSIQLLNITQNQISKDKLFQNLALVHFYIGFLTHKTLTGCWMNFFLWSIFNFSHRIKLSDLCYAYNEIVIIRGLTMTTQKLQD